jgi:hypothetical protein
MTHPTTLPWGSIIPTGIIIIIIIIIITQQRKVIRTLNSIFH